MKPRQLFQITSRGRNVLRGPTLWALSSHLRDVLALCDPQADREVLRQFLPPDSLQSALYALQQLELISGPAVPAPDHSQWEFQSPSRRLNPPSRTATAPAAVARSA